MPTAPDYLREMFEDDDAAIAVIDEHFEWHAPPTFVIRPKVWGYQMTEQEMHAIDYLIAEWDWLYVSKEEHLKRYSKKR